MDPQSVSFQPQTDIWRFQNELSRVQAVQQDHSDRLLRLERKQDEDTRMKSVWGGTSPFPSVLSGTPQQRPLQHPSTDHFSNFDDDSNNMINSLHLDAEEEPRRIGATSRANSVRFDESANQGHWSHASRSSMDFLARSGGLPMNERTSSHKSEGRASSVHSVRSAASGRASSINLDVGFGQGDLSRSPLDTPGLAPGLLILGSVPAIIRCWMNTNFKHDALLYAAVCSGSHKSFLHREMVENLGFQGRIMTSEEGVQTIVLPVYLPEAVPHPSSTRSGSPAPQLPTITVTFNIMDSVANNAESKAIKIVLGSDTLRMHSADILLSSNKLSLLDDDRNKLSMPLVRPEEQRTFDGLRTTSGPSLPSFVDSKAEEATGSKPTVLNGLGQSTQSSAEKLPLLAGESPHGKWRRSIGVGAEEEGTDTTGSDHGESSGSRPASRASVSRPANLPAIGTKPETKERQVQLEEPVSQTPTPVRSGSSPAIWSNWRREASGPPQTSQFDWANANKPREAPPQRRDTGMKVLRPMKTSSRTFSTTSAAASPSPADGKSRFFDDGKRRAALDAGDARSEEVAQTTEGASTMEMKENQTPTPSGSGPKSRSNPAGGASAFAWLNQGGSR